MNEHTELEETLLKLWSGSSKEQLLGRVVYLDIENTNLKDKLARAQGLLDLIEKELKEIKYLVGILGG